MKNAECRMEGTKGPRDYGTMGLRDEETKGLRDEETTTVGGRKAETGNLRPVVDGGGGWEAGDGE